MLDKKTARKLAEECVSEGWYIDDADVRELREGWFFPYKVWGPPAGRLTVLEQLSRPMGGSQGVVINKRTGAAFELGSCFPIQRDLDLYDKGYQFDAYDLVVTSVNDLAGAIAALIEIGISVEEATYEHGIVWRNSRPLTSDELKARLAKLPCIFSHVGLYFRIETLERARAAGVMECDVLKTTGKRR